MMQHDTPHLHPGLSAAVVPALLLLSLTAQAETSRLWGEEGELFEPQGRLMDWSYAGYHAGEEPLPWRPSSIDVTDFGAVAGDDIDDTEAFLSAIDSLDGGGVVAIPAGTFIISDMIRLTDGVVLRGAGRTRTTLHIPVSFTDLRGNPGLDAGEHSSYMIEPGFIRAQGTPEGEELATITVNADRGDREIHVSNTDGLEAGQWIFIRQTDDEGTLLARLHADLMEPNEGGYGESWTWRDRVTAVSGDTIELERPLPLDIRQRWSPRILAFAPSTSEVGVEHLTIRFPRTEYPGHFQEQGYNGINFHRVVNSWIRDVRILNSDNGIKVTGSSFVTVTGVILDTTGSRGSSAGHHGFNIANGGDNLIVDFEVRDPFIHDVTTTFYATGTVFANGSGADLNMDHHSRSPYATLWTNLDLGAGTRPFASSGARSFHPHSAAYGTFWNVRADRRMDLPGLDTSGMGFGPRLNFVGFRTNATSGDDDLEWWLEAIPPSSLEPANIYEAMRDARLGVDTVFSSIPLLGDLAEYQRRTPSRWDIYNEDGDRRLRLNTSAYTRDGDAVGEYALLPTSTTGDFTMRVSAKTAENLEHNPAGDYALIFDFQDEENYHYLLANGTADFTQLFLLEDGVRTALATATEPLIPNGEWHDLELARRGEVVIVTLDGEEVMRVVADRWTEGALGVGSYNDAVFFDDITLTFPSDVGDAGVPDGGVTDDAGGPDAGAPDAATATDGGDGGPSEGDDAGDADVRSRGGCQVVGTGSPGTGVVVMLMMLVFAHRRGHHDVNAARKSPH